MNMHNPPHLGEFIREVYLDELDLSARTVAAAIKVSPSSFTHILNGKSSVTTKWPCASPKHEAAHRKAGWSCKTATTSDKRANIFRCGNQRGLTQEMIILMPREMTWIKGQTDDPNDLCAHGKVQFEINGETLVSVHEGEWTVSATALYLLRTLEKDHTKESPLFEHVIPCCGFSMYDIEGEENALIIGCPNGIDFEIRHIDNHVEIKRDGKETSVITNDAWNRAVINFSEAVNQFYKLSSPKTPHDEEASKGFAKFRAEWEKRYEIAIQGISLDD